MCLFVYVSLFVLLFNCIACLETVTRLRLREGRGGEERKGEGRGEYKSRRRRHYYYHDVNNSFIVSIFSPIVSLLLP